MRRLMLVPILLFLLMVAAALVTGLSGCPPKNPPLVADTASVTVPEGGTASFQVKLRSRPSSDTVVMVSRSSGDADITIQSGTGLRFDTFNWGYYQTVTLAAASDADTENGSATIHFSGQGISLDVAAVEQDSGAGTGEGEGESATEGEGEGEGEPAAGEVETVMLPGNVPLDLVWIPAGVYTMGSPDNEQDRNSDEGPQRQVTISHGFWMGRFEVTQAQWKAVMGGANPSHFQGAVVGDVDTGSHPVEQVSWNAITQTFLPALNTAAARTFRLPTEAEWEFACRANAASRFYWGDDLGAPEIGDYAWYGTNSGSQTHEVGTAGPTGNPNVFGLYDMSGNVWEWCQDWYDSYPAGAAIDPTGPETPPMTGSYRVLRGGSWNRSSQNCRSAERFNTPPDFSNSEFGFRVVMAP